MEPEDYQPKPKSARQPKAERNFDSHQRPRTKKNQRTDYSSYLAFQIKQPQPALSAPQRPKRKPSANRNVTLSPYFRFAVKFPADYSNFHLDPNLPLDWDSVMHVIKLTDNEFACPICLEDRLIAPRVSSCGHCFCYPCILQYLAHEEQRDKRCPVCFDTVRAAGLKPVEVRKTTAVSEGYTATFRLMRRAKGSLSLYACGQPITGHRYQKLPDARSPDAVYNRLCVAFSPKDIWKQHIDQLVEARSSLDPVFCSRALELTTHEADRIPDPGLVKVPPYDASCSCCKTIHPLTLNIVDAKVCPLHGKDTVELTYDCSQLPVSTEPERDEETYYYFYQLADGQPYFLHPLTNRYLARQFGAWSGLPDTLTAPVLQVEDTVMTDSVRGKMKVLSHLSKGAGFFLVELDLTGICTPAVLEVFAEESAARRLARTQHRAREERQHQVTQRRKEEQERKTQEFYRLPAAVPTPFVNEPLLPPSEEVPSVWNSFKEAMERPKPPPLPKAQKKPPAPSRRKTSDPDYEELMADESYSQYIVETRGHKLGDLLK